MCANLVCSDALSEIIDAARVAEPHVAGEKKERLSASDLIYFKLSAGAG